MDAQFWLDRWRQGRTGWQQAEPGALLLRHFGVLGLQPGARVFVPLCGASPDLGWLLAQGCAVVGAEFSGLAVAQVFQTLGVVPDVTTHGALQRHSVPGLDLFQGDIFDLTPAQLGPVDAIHDRAALFALPSALRPAYAAHLVALTGAAPQLLNCLEHDTGTGPPFSVTADEVARLYGDTYRITLLDDAPDQLFASLATARNRLWHLG